MGKERQDGRGQEGQGGDQESDSIASASIKDIASQDGSNDPTGKGGGMDGPDDLPQRPGPEERADQTGYRGYLPPIKEAIDQGKAGEHPKVFDTD